MLGIGLHDAVGVLHPHAAQGHEGGLESGVDAGRDLQRAVGLGAVAQHAGHVADHVGHRAANGVVVAAQQVSNGAGGAGARHGGAAQGAQAAELGLDADGHQMAHGHGTEHLFFGNALPAGQSHGGHGGGDALVAAAGVGHDGVGCAGHTGVGAGGGDHHGVGHHVPGHEAVAAVALQAGADGQAVLLLQTLLADGAVHAHRAADDVDGVVHGVQFLVAEIIDLAQGQELGDLFGRDHVLVAAAGGGAAIGHHVLAVRLEGDQVGMQVGDDRAGGVGVAVHNDFDVQFLGHIGMAHSDLAALHQKLGSFVNIVRNAVDDFQLLFRSGRAGADGGGVAHAGVLGAGDAGGHGVLQDVGGGVDFHTPDHLAPLVQLGARVSAGEGDGARLGTAGGQLHFAVQNSEEHRLVHTLALLFSLRPVNGGARGGRAAAPARRSPRIFPSTPAHSPGFSLSF